ncbi:MAG: RNA polymerase sigma factor [Armatimonadetes bacterium]|nr:RNA polymerase sigma factor [Armatimonadota bacterium]
MLRSVPDEQLVKRCLAGDGRAAEALFSRHQDYVYRLCYGMLGHPQDAEDAAQEAFVRALSRLESFRGGSAFRTWLHRVTVTTCLDLLRRKKNVVPLDDTPEMEAPRSSSHSMRLEVEEALEHLDPDERAALVLREVEGLSYQEMAELLDCTVEAVRSRLYRARQHFRRVYEPVSSASGRQR